MHRSSLCSSRSPGLHAVVWLLLLFCDAVASAVDTEECSSPGSTLNAALSDDGYLSLSLIQVKAVAKRNNKTHHMNQSLLIGEGMLNATLAAAPSRFAEGLAASSLRYGSLPVFYVAFAMFVFVVIVNFSMLCSHLQLQESDKLKSSMPKMKYPVDHLVAASKLNVCEKSKSEQQHQSSFYARANRIGAGSRADGLAAPAEQLTMVGKPQHGIAAALDPRLVLPLRETWYAVAIAETLKAGGSFDILRITGSPSLCANLNYSSGRRGVLEVFCQSGGTASLLARVSTGEPQSLLANGDTPEPEVASLPLILVDAEQRCLGQLRPSPCKGFELIRDNEVAMTLAGDCAGQLELSNSDGSGVACVSCVAGHLGICVNAGADTGLVVCLVLAAVLLGGAGMQGLPNGDHSGDQEPPCHS